ncbi:ABC transporter ATP-binding protein [Janibacter alittae]|uniref:ABC transporter ATP-binding protein n=1 Tax=Janibacter alittae TaxID=3115209 RepID=A0ABZ2MGE1_9MICO
MISATGLRFAYGTTEIIRDISLAARPGRVLGLIGPNGSGKTTLLRLLHGGLTPAAGEVLIDDTRLDGIDRRTISRRIAVVVQEAGGEMTMTAAEMVLLGRTARLSGFQRTGEGDIAAARAALQRVGALDLAKRDFAGLSGGEKQRVLIARSLAQDADHLLLDEPTNHLDIRYQHEVLGLLRGLATTTVVVLHDLNLAARYCDDVVLLCRGEVAGAGTVDAVLEPDLLTRVYGIGVRRVDDADGLHLFFTPLRQEVA